MALAINLILHKTIKNGYPTFDEGIWGIDS